MGIHLLNGQEHKTPEELEAAEKAKREMLEDAESNLLNQVCQEVERQDQMQFDLRSSGILAIAAMIRLVRAFDILTIKDMQKSDKP